MDLKFLEDERYEVELFSQLLKPHLEITMIDEGRAPEESDVKTPEEEQMDNEMKYLEMNDCKVQNETTNQAKTNEIISHEEQLVDLDYILKFLKNRDVDAETVYKSVMLRRQKYKKA